MTWSRRRLGTAYVELIEDSEATLKVHHTLISSEKHNSSAGCTSTRTSRRQRRLYYNDCAMIALNGRIITQGSQFSLTVVEDISATIDIEDVRAHRAKSRRSMQAAAAECYHRIEAPIALSGGKFDVIEELNRPAARPYEGYFLPLSGGIDSCTTAMIAYLMYRLAINAARSRMETHSDVDAQWIVVELKYVPARSCKLI
ncbi:hypothetical protein EDB89DRAFT_1912374 [Lactarius sanguifluus]|nr:hypothetical protein EDB89DRAFT_1912374 [Lactarius sanguifluus]